jgi:hypothetical protein
MHCLRNSKFVFVVKMAIRLLLSFPFLSESLAKADGQSTSELGVAISSSEIPLAATGNSDARQQHNDTNGNALSGEAMSEKNETNENHDKLLKESIMTNLTFSFVGEIYDPTTFAVRTTGADIKQSKVYRLGNVLVTGDQERGLRALRRKISKSAMILTRDAPEEEQYFPVAERVRYQEVLETRRKDVLRKQVREELAQEGIFESSENAGAQAQYSTGYSDTQDTADVGLNGVWRNITVVDAWTFDGTHLAKVLADDFPGLFEFSGDPYLLDADLRRAMTIEETGEPAEPEKNTKSSNYHILQARGAIRKNLAFKKVSQLMADIGKDSAEGAAAADLLGIKAHKKTKESKDAEKEDLVAQGSAMVMVLCLVAGAYMNFGRAQKKWKSKPSAKFINQEKQSLGYTMSAKPNANVRVKPRKERVAEYRESSYN